MLPGRTAGPAVQPALGANSLPVAVDVRTSISVVMATMCTELPRSSSLQRASGGQKIGLDSAAAGPLHMAPSGRSFIGHQTSSRCGCPQPHRRNPAIRRAVCLRWWRAFIHGQATTKASSGIVRASRKGLTASAAERWHQGRVLGRHWPARTTGEERAVAPRARSCEFHSFSCE